MPYVTTKDHVEIFYKDSLKDAQPIVFHHGWPLSADDWDAQMLFFVQKGYRWWRDRRGHGRSAQVSDGHDMDHYAADAFAVVEALDLRNAVHIGHSTGGGEVARYVAKHGEPAGRVAKAVLVSAVPPLMVKTASNPEGLPIEVFDGFRKALADNRAQFFLDVPSGPFYGFNREGATVHQGVIRNWWRQGWKAARRRITKASGVFGNGPDGRPEVDLRPDARAAWRRRPDRADRGCRAEVDQAAEERHAEDVPGYSHGMLTINADVLNADLLAFVQA